MLEKDDIYISSIIKLISIIINQYGLEKPRPTILKKWVLNIDNPNGLDISAELRNIDIWLGENPARSKKWRKDWRKRIQGWIYRTKRPEIENRTFSPVKAIHTLPEPEPVRHSSFTHTCGQFCDSPCWYRELTQKMVNDPGFVQQERRRLQNVYNR